MAARPEDDLRVAEVPFDAAELLEDAQTLYGLTGVHGIIAHLSRRVRARTGASLVISSYVRPGKPWADGCHLVAETDCTEPSPETISAAFAVHHRLATKPASCSVVRSSETEPIFLGLSGSGPGPAELWAIPLVNRRKRLVGQVVLCFPDARSDRADTLVPALERLATLTCGALENVERLAFARRDQDRLQLIAEASSDALWDWDLQSDELWWGGGIEKVVRDGSEMIGTNGRWKMERIHPADIEATRRSLDEAIASPASSWRHEFRFRRGDGSWAMVEDHGYVLRAANGGAYRMIGALRDVSERKWTALQQTFLGAASAVLAESLDVERNLRKTAELAVETVADWCAIVLLNREENQAKLVALASGSCERAGDVAVTVASVLRPAMFLDDQAAMVLPDVSESWRQSVIAADPAFAPVSDSVSPLSVLHAPIGSPEHLLGTVTLVSSVHSARRYQQSDLAWGEELARHCASAIEKARLYEQAQNAIRARDAFMVILGHELRNPLSPITTALQLMKLRDPKSRREQEVIERQVKHLTRLVDDLLDVSWIERGKIDLFKKPTQLAEVVAKAVEIASPLFEERRHRLELNVPTQGMTVLADETRLAQAFANLLTNAARYTDPGGHVRAEATREGGEIVFRVRDNGIGMARELVPQVFDLFVQGPRTADRHAGGLGLGLSLVRSLVTLHGGSVEAHSAGLALGSEFVVRLPAVPVELVRNESAVAMQQHAGPQGLKILIVDDNEDAAISLAELLDRLGNEVRVAYDGPEALTVAPGFAPDVAILDIGLPVMDGYELARRLAENLPRRPYFMALTGYGQEHDRSAATAAGFDAHLVKPVDIELLMRTLDAVTKTDNFARL